ncbi:MAG: CBS domain-containing protein [Micavibrio aeruginosavorus]|nr:CBS domain-containing protein [Micavibrio aeruginosavorus]
MRATEAKEKNGEIAVVGDIATTRQCLSFHPDQFIKIILAAMQHARTGCAGVIDDDGHLVGMLTERDILRRIFEMVADSTINRRNIGKYVDDMMVRDIMIAAPKVFDDDTDIEDALAVMTELGFRFMPVVSRYDRRKLVGLVDEREVAIHVKNRLDRIKLEAAQKEAIFYSFWREPYGMSFDSPAS